MGGFGRNLFGDVYIEHEERGSRRDGTSKYWRFWLPQLLRSLLMISCAWKRSVKALSSSTIEPIVESSQVEGRSWSEDTVRASDYIVADSAFLMRELSPANAGITRSFFYYFCFVFGERPVLFGREPNPVIRSWDKRGHVQTATRAQWVGAIDAAHFHDLHTLCIPSISENINENRDLCRNGLLLR